MVQWCRGQVLQSQNQAAAAAAGAPQQGAAAAAAAPLQQTAADESSVLGPPAKRLRASEGSVSSDSSADLSDDDF
ncbi:hypothetical protein ENH_00027900 [Eimeria necatrix]|uniref:Uncharacterized protein n=1 Tax=Eimeria necatrix TaxID=51315 RepID=U6MV34_9EIME|nr:hypothetical protein ENH_00027900 [Eimeria necatrix]CDJ66963.1 hypothetical protein ENH_00027900 [Eimeria necatrix]